MLLPLGAQAQEEGGLALVAHGVGEQRAVRLGEGQGGLRVGRADGAVEGEDPEREVVGHQRDDHARVAVGEVEDAVVRIAVPGRVVVLGVDPGAVAAQGRAHRREGGEGNPMAAHRRAREPPAGGAHPQLLPLQQEHRSEVVGDHRQEGIEGLRQQAIHRRLGGGEGDHLAEVGGQVEGGRGHGEDSGDDSPHDYSRCASRQLAIGPPREGVPTR